MLIPQEKIEEAKAIYDGQAIQEIIEHFGIGNYDDKNKSCSCPFHHDSTPSFIWNEKTNCFHCFGKETRVITKDGVQAIEDIISQPIEIINGDGNWETVTFKSYGVQKLMKLNLSSNGKQKVLYATPEHEWLVKDKDYKIRTNELKFDTCLQSMWSKDDSNITLDILGWKVVSVEETDRVEEVYCCVTSTHSFVLEDFILTGNCFSCNRNYGIIDLYMEKGMSFPQAVQKLFTNTNISYGFGELGLQTKASYKYPIHEDAKERTIIEDYLGQRGISPKTMDYADIQQTSAGNIAFHFYDENDVLCMVRYRVGHKFNKDVDKLGKHWCQKGADTAPILFNMNRIDPCKPLVITEGEIDCLSVLEAGYTNTVSIPMGCQNMHWIEYNWDWLEQFNKIILWFDNDEPGIKARNEAVRRLGTWRTYYVECTDINKFIQTTKLKCKDANEILVQYGKQRVLEYISAPIEIPVEGVSNLAEAEDFDIENASGLYTGIKDLDDKIYKLVFGTVNIITGKSGEGKSVFVNQVAICQALQQGYDVFVFSGELPSPVLKNWVEVNMIGRDYITMKDNHIRQLDSGAKKAMKDWYSGRVMVYDDSIDTTASSLIHKMEEMARKFGTKVFLIDNLMMVDLECSEEGRLQAEKEFIKNLILFAKKFDVLIFLVAHPRKTGEIMVTKEDISGSSNIVNLAHMVFSIHRYTDKEKEGSLNGRGEYIKGCEPKEYDSCVEVLKNRITGLLPRTELYFDYNSYRFYHTPEELWFRYNWNEDKSPLRKDDPNRKGVTPL